MKHSPAAFLSAGLLLALLCVVLLMIPEPAFAQAPTPGTGVPEFKLTPQSLIELGAFILSLFFKYAPKLRTWFARQETETKSGLMILMLALLTVGVSLLACFDLLIIPDFQCSQVGFVSVAYTFVWAVAINQGAYKLFPDTTDVRMAKAARTTAWQNVAQ